jgi:type IV pilus assembly protein PilW
LLPASSQRHFWRSLLHHQDTAMKTRHRITLGSQLGVTLVELMISVTLGLLLSAVATYVYQSVQTSSRNLEAQALRNENANIMFDLIGRDLKLSGYFPAHFPSEATDKFRGKFVDVLDGSPVLSTAAFRQAIFGCSNASLNTTSGLCNAPTANAPDSIIVNYFTDDTFANSWEGSRRDCLSSTIEQAAFSGFAYNKNRADPVSANPLPTSTVAAPLLIQNVYSLSGIETATYYTDRSVQTRSARCTGNNSDPATGTRSPPQPLVQGIEQMRISYGLFNPQKNSYSAEQLYSAAQVDALPVIQLTNPINKEITSITGWQRVATIQLCTLTKTLDPNARLTTGTATYADCDNILVTPANGDRAIYKRQIRRFTVRNNIPSSYE